MKKTFFAVLTFLLTLSCLWTLRASDDKDYEFANLDGIWFSKNDENLFLRQTKLSAADQAIALQKRDSILRILMNSSVFNPLKKGVALRTQKSGVSHNDRTGYPDTKSPVELSVRMMIGRFYRDKATGTVKPIAMEHPNVRIETNSIVSFPFGGQETDEQGRVYFLEPYATAKTDNGLKIYLRDETIEVVFITNGRPLWIPATREQYLRVKMKTARKWRADEIKDSQDSGNPPPSEEDSVGVRVLRNCEAELAALPPAERQQPAWFAQPKGDDFLKSGLARAGEEGARPVVILNLENYYNRSLPRSAVQLITLSYNYMVPYRSDETEPVHNSIALSLLNDMVRHLEYEKLAALIEK